MLFNIRDLNAIIEQKPDVVNIVNDNHKSKIVTSTLNVLTVDSSKDLQSQMTGFLELMGIALDFETTTTNMYVFSILQVISKSCFLLLRILIFIVMNIYYTRHKYI